MRERGSGYFEVWDDKGVPGRWYLGALEGKGGPLDPRIFMRGEPVLAPGELTVGLRRPGVALDFTMADYGLPVASGRAAQVFRSACGGDVQLIPVEVPGHGQYFIVNATRTCDCVDEGASAEIVRWVEADGRPEMLGRYKSIAGLRIDPGRASGHLFRVRGWEVSLVISGAARRALEDCGLVGLLYDSVA